VPEVDENGNGFDVLGLDCACCGLVVSNEVFVVIVLPPEDVAVAVDVETCAAAANDPVNTPS
jgi:hypothetical protein